MGANNLQGGGGAAAGTTEKNRGATEETEANVAPTAPGPVQLEQVRSPAPDRRPRKTVVIPHKYVDLSVIRFDFSLYSQWDNGAMEREGDSYLEVAREAARRVLARPARRAPPVLSTGGDSGPEPDPWFRVEIMLPEVAGDRWERKKEFIEKVDLVLQEVAQDFSTGTSTSGTATAGTGPFPEFVREKLISRAHSELVIAGFPAVTCLFGEDKGPDQNRIRDLHVRTGGSNFSFSKDKLAKASEDAETVLRSLFKSSCVYLGSVFWVLGNPASEVVSRMLVRLESGQLYMNEDIAGAKNMLKELFPNEHESKSGTEGEVGADNLQGGGGPAVDNTSTQEEAHKGWGGVLVRISTARPAAAARPAPTARAAPGAPAAAHTARRRSSIEQ